MSDHFVEAFVDKLILLERIAGASAHYRIMPPFAVPFHDINTVQKAVRIIAEFIELKGFVFVVDPQKQKEHVAGNIDLSTKDEFIFIEVDDTLMKDFPDAIGATLCHEVCHKWLQIKGIAAPIERDNEILTDITSVFLGFGKIMLNGCQTSRITFEKSISEKKMITKTTSVGYLDQDQLAFVYCLVCAMRNIPSSDIVQGLTATAARAVEQCNLSFGQHYAPCYHQIDAIQNSVTGFTGLLDNSRYTLADLDKHVVYIKQGLCEVIDVFLKGGHKKIEALRQKASEMILATPQDPALRFIQAIKIEFEIKRFISQANTVSQEAAGLLQHAKGIGRHLARNRDRFPAPAPQMFTIVTCPQDGTKLRLPENSGDIIARCPKCNYSFPYNTNVPVFPEPSSPAKLTWRQKFKRLFIKR